jgi:hypothetical protein
LAAIGLVPLLLSGTRSAVVALLVALLVGFLTSLQKGWATVATVWFGLLGIIILMSGAVDAILNPDVASSASFVHRTSVIESAARLIDRPLDQAVFGSGGSSIDELFASGVVQGFQGLFFFDNQWIRSLALSGLVGMAILGVMFVVGIKRSDDLRRLLLIQLLVMTFSFDVMTWPIAVLLVAIGVVFYVDPSSPAMRSTKRWNSAAVRAGEKDRS